MKRIIFTILILSLGICATAQQKPIHFNKKVSYNLVLEQETKGINKEESDMHLMDYYFSDNTQVGLMYFNFNSFFNPLYNFINNTVFIKNGNVLSQSIGPDGKPTKHFENYFYEIEKQRFYSELKFSSEITFTKMDKKDIINGYECQYYKISDSDQYSNSSCLCLDTKSEYKNLKISIPNTSGIDALIVSFGEIQEDGKIENIVYLTGKEDTDFNVYFDFDTEYKKMEEALKKYLKEYEVYLDDNETTLVESTDSEAQAIEYESYENDPLSDVHYNIGKYISPINEHSIILSVFPPDYYFRGKDRLKNIKITKNAVFSALETAKEEKVILEYDYKDIKDGLNKLFEEAENFKPEKHTTFDFLQESVSTNRVDIPIPAYQSVYKTVDTKEQTLALNQDYITEQLKKSIPQYCSELEKRIPKFEDKKLAQEVSNYVAQLCDLYLEDQIPNYVDLVGTLNSMRKSLLEIENKRDKLSKKDKKMLNEFINSLD